MLARLGHIRNWIFDLDNTLYPASANLFAPIEARMNDYICELTGCTPEQGARMRRDYFHSHGTTLAGLMAEHGTDPHHFLDFVHDVDMNVLARNELLAGAIARLPGRKLVFTNGTVAHAQRVMDRLGVARHFEAVFDIHAAAYVPKPEPVVYDQLLSQYAIQPRRAVLFEDMARNLKPAHDLGMTTVWVRVDSPWAQPGDDRSHIHHEIDDLAEWLVAYNDTHGKPAPARD